MTNKENQNEKQLPINKQEYDDLVALCLEMIEKNNILFVKELVAFLPISRATFYNYKLDKLDTIKNAIENQRIFTKQGLRAKWFQGGSAVTQIALYRLIATPEERAAISNHPQYEQQPEEQKELPIKQLFESLRRSMKNND